MRIFLAITWQTQGDEGLLLTICEKAHSVCGFKIGGEGIGGAKVCTKTVAAVFGICLLAHKYTREGFLGIRGKADVGLLARGEKTRRKGV